jgi:hypothetical protein
LEECCKEQGHLAEASKEGLGSEWAVVPMMMIFSDPRFEVLTPQLQHLWGGCTHKNLLP